MSTLALTHESISKALTDGAPLTDDQRAVLLGLVARDKQEQRERDALVEHLRTQNRHVAQQIIDNERAEAVKWAKGLIARLDADLHVERIPACWIDGGDLDQLAKYGMGGVLGWADDGGDPRRVPVYR